jgi:hypothetical protein
MSKEKLYGFLAVFIMIGFIIAVICVVANVNNVAAEPTTVVTTFDTVPTTEPTETIHIEEPEVPSEALSAPTSEETIPPMDYYELEMLAIVIYQEAGGNKQCDDCRRRVADIVLNRVADHRFPDTIEEVLTQKKQYGRLYITGIKWPKRAQYDSEKDAVTRAYRIAEEVLNGQHSDVYGEGYIWQAGFKQGKDGFWHCGHYFGRS